MNDKIIRDSVKWHPLYKPVFFNLFEAAEPKMTPKNFAEPKLPSEKLRGTQITLRKTSRNPNYPQKNFAEPKLPLILC